LSLNIVGGTALRRLFGETVCGDRAFAKPTQP